MPTFSVSNGSKADATLAAGMGRKQTLDKALSYNVQTVLEASAWTLLQTARRQSGCSPHE